VEYVHHSILGGFVSHTEYSSESWFDRIKGSFRSVLTGLALFVVAFPILFFNEGRAVKTARSLEEGAGAVVSVPSDKVDAANDGKLVHFSGTATPKGTLEDPLFGISVPALHFYRSAEMYQWVEKQKEEKDKKVGGAVEKKITYTYEKGWSAELIDSKEFKEKKDHDNPATLPVPSEELHAADVTVGAFTLPANLIARIDNNDKFPVDEALLAKVSPTLRGKLKVHNQTFYLGADPANPAIGDVKISFSVVKPAAVSIAAQQAGNSLMPYKTKAGGNVELLEDGTVTAAQMFQSAQDNNSTLTWILRLLGFLAMAIGLYLVFRPVAVLGDVIPFVGSMLAFGAGAAGLVVSFALSLVTIAVAWFFYRPVLSIVLLVLGVGGFVGLKMATKGKGSPPPG